MSERDDRRHDRAYADSLRPAGHRSIVVPALPWLEHDAERGHHTGGGVPTETADTPGKSPRSFPLPGPESSGGKRWIQPCYACGEKLPYTEFAPDRSKSSGRKSICRVCDRAKSRAYYLANRERKIAAVRRRYQERTR
jgi:hypothetical protein